MNKINNPYCPVCMCTLTIKNPNLFTETTNQTAISNITFCSKECHDFMLVILSLNVNFKLSKFKMHMLANTSTKIIPAENYEYKEEPYTNISRIAAVCKFCNKRLFKHKKHFGYLFEIKAKNNKQKEAILIKICNENCLNLWLLKEG